MTLVQVRRYALSLPDTVEAPHFYLTSFRVRGKIFATAALDGEFLHAFIAPEEVDEAVAAAPDHLAVLVWGGKVGGVRVFLGGATADLVNPLLRRAWTRRAPRKLVAAAAALP